MKHIVSIVLVMAALCLTACGSAPAQQAVPVPSEEPTPAPAPDLSGEWKQINADADTYHAAAISGDSIEIYWVNPANDTKSLYWAGTFTAPQDGAEPYVWQSTNDKDKTSHALLASSDDEKTFTYEGGVISYEAAAMGVTKTVKLEKHAANYTLVT